MRLLANCYTPFTFTFTFTTTTTTVTPVYRPQKLMVFGDAVASVGPYASVEADDINKQTVGLYSGEASANCYTPLYFTLLYFNWFCYLRDTMLARVLAMTVCPCLSVCVCMPQVYVLAEG